LQGTIDLNVVGPDGVIEKGYNIQRTTFKTRFKEAARHKSTVETELTSPLSRSRTRPITRE
jgi:hypothetical protein